MISNIKFLVTGGAGFIGSHIVDLLVDLGYEVNVIDNLAGGNLQNLDRHLSSNKLRIFIDDITTINLHHESFKGITCILHLAGLGDIVPSIKSPLDYFKVNCLGTVRVLEAARLNNISRIVYAASSSCYGLAKVPTKETDEVSPQHPYAFTKYLGEVSLFHWAKVYNIQVNSIRIFNAYGTRSKTNGNYGAMFGVFMKQLIEKVPLTVVGDGEQSRDFVYVTDVAKAFLLAATSESHGEIFNVGSGNPRTINEIVSILKTDSIYLPERPGEPKVTWANIRKAKNILGWNPTVTLENGIAKMLAEINYWRTAPLWTEEKIASATSDWFKHLGKADKNDNK